jgi:FemAB family protein
VMQQGGIAKLQHELFVSLNLDINDIKSRFRQSYKSLISSGERLWQVGLMQDYDEPVWGEFRELHFSAAGKSTRSALSWELQHKAIRDGDAFLVHLRDQENRMVGGGFFHVTRDEGLYAVGAYDRSLFSRPLGHVVQFYAIREMQRRGLKWYKIGYRPYPGDVPEPSPKEIAIGEFKDGFASHTFPRYQLVHGVVSKF